MRKRIGSFDFHFSVIDLLYNGFFHRLEVFNLIITRQWGCIVVMNFRLDLYYDPLYHFKGKYYKTQSDVIKAMI